MARVRVMAKRYVVTLRKFWWIPVLTLSLGLVVSVWKGMNLPPSFLSSAQMVITGQFQMESGIRMSEPENYISTQFALILSPQVAQRARKKILSAHPDWLAVPVNVDISQTARTSFVALKATGIEPLYTQAFLDAIMQEYKAVMKEMRNEKSDDMTSAIKQQLLLLEKETDADERALLRFQQENNNGMVKEQSISTAQFLSAKEGKLADLKAELDLLDTLNLDQQIDRGKMAAAAAAATTAPSTTTPAGAPPDTNRSTSTLDSSLANSYGPMTDYQRAKQEVLTLKAQRDEYLKGNMKPQNPVIKEIEAKIVDAENLMEIYRTQSKDVLKIRRESILIQIQSLQKVIAEASIKAMDLSQKLAEFDRLKLKLDQDQKQYDQMITTLHSVNVYKNVEQDRLSILENASPAVSIKPGMAKTLMGGIFTGLFAGLAILFLLDKMDDRIGSLVECQGQFKDYPVLGEIPREDMSGDLALLVPYDPRQTLMEAFRALRSSIIFTPVEGARPKAIMITSAMPEEGKTSIASNLAITLAFSGAKTLLVDCDLAAGRLHDIFGTAPEVGLVNVLQQEVPWSEAVVQTSLDNLFLLPRGEAPSHPAEHFFGTFLKEVYPEFDYIIFDSASIMDNVDALSFAPIVDGVLFVVRLAQTSSGKANSAIELLGARQVNILGLICNEV